MLRTSRRFCLAAVPVLMALAFCRGEGPSPVRPGVCGLCGMETASSRARFVLDFDDGTRVETCSGACAARLKLKSASRLYRARALTADTTALVDVTAAVFVLNAETLPPGSMPPSCFAFESRDAALAFADRHGGTIAGADDVWRLAAVKGVPP